MKHMPPITLCQVLDVISVALILLFGVSLTSCNKSNPKPTAPADKQLLVGTWSLVGVRSVSEHGEVYDVPPDEVAADPLTYIFRSDGTGTQIYKGSDSEFSWSAQGDKLNVTRDWGPWEYVYSVNSSTLSLTFDVEDDESGETYINIHTFTRLPNCPTYTTLKHLDAVSIEQWQHYFGDILMTGAGAFTGIEVGPSSENWDGLNIQESVRPAPDGDPCGLASRVGKPEGFFCSCDGSPCQALFTVGAKFAGTPPGVADAEHNVFWDLHRIPSLTESLLHRLSLNDCTVSCIQEYSCSGVVIGRYLITYTLTRDDALGKTRVSVVKTPLAK
jgi:hypothetical protein